MPTLPPCPVEWCFVFLGPSRNKARRGLQKKWLSRSEAQHPMGSSWGFWFQTFLAPPANQGGHVKTTKWPTFLQKRQTTKQKKSKKRHVVQSGHHDAGVSTNGLLTTWDLGTSWPVFICICAHLFLTLGKLWARFKRSSVSQWGCLWKGNNMEQHK